MKTYTVYENQNAIGWFKQLEDARRFTKSRVERIIGKIVQAGTLYHSTRVGNTWCIAIYDSEKDCYDTIHDLWIIEEQQ